MDDIIYEDYKIDMYQGQLIDLTTLDVGTKFTVTNGGWYGEIVEREGEKLCLMSNGRYLKIKGDEGLYIIITEGQIPKAPLPTFDEFKELYFYDKLKILDEESEDISEYNGESRTVVFLHTDNRCYRINIWIDYGAWNLDSISIDRLEEYVEVVPKEITKTIYVDKK